MNRERLSALNTGFMRLSSSSYPRLRLADSYDSCSSYAYRISFAVDYAYSDSYYLHILLIRLLLPAMQICQIDMAVDYASYSYYSSIYDRSGCFC